MTMPGEATREDRKRTMNTVGRLTAIAVALGVGLALASTPATAAPTASGARLSIYTDPATPKTSRVTIDGLFPMSEADAVGFLNNIYTGAQPGGMEYRIFRDDNGDESGGRTYWIAGNGSFDGYHLMATREGIHHLFIINESNDFLNEDDSVLDDDDEIYVQATFVDADGGRRSQISNVVTGRF
jgi:hypothetical protein